jgi:hypothetical protein
MDKIFESIPEVLDQATRTGPGLAALSFLILGGTTYLLFGSTFEFLKLLTFVIVALAYLGFLLATGRL